MKSLKLIIILLLVSKLSFTQTLCELEKNKFEISIKLEATKRKSDKYFDNDTNMYTIDQKQPEKYYRNNNYLALESNLPICLLSSFSPMVALQYHAPIPGL